MGQAAEAQVPDLPADVIAVLLQHVGTKQRLTSCALVCKAWHVACCASVTSLSITFHRQRRADSAFRWLTQRGSNVTSVRMVVSEAAEKLTLDCDLQAWSWVKDLRLTGFNLRQGPSPSEASKFPAEYADTCSRSHLVRCKSSSRLAELTSLTRLELDGCAVPDDLVALAALTDLEHLTVSVMTHDPAGVSSAPFAALSKLTHLHIGVDVCDSTCSTLSCLQALQELHISKYAAISHCGLAQLGQLQQLTHLRINCASYVIDPQNVPGFSDLCGLKTLEVTDSKQLNPAVLRGLSSLQTLAIVDTPINPRGVSASTAAGVPTLLSLLPGLQHLTSLTLADCLTWPQPPQAYAALTACPNLALLVLRCCNLPAGACQAMFPQDRVLQQLTQLVVHSNWPISVTLEAGDVLRLVRCCPALRQLDADLSKQSVEQLQPLKSLTALSHLSVSDMADAGLAVLAQLPLLRHLDLDRVKGLTTQGLVQLTGLKGVTQLRFKAPGPSLGGISTPHARIVHLRKRVDGAQPPDVCWQLARILRAGSGGGQHHHQSSGGGDGSSSSGVGANHPAHLNSAAEMGQLLLATQAFWLNA